MFWRISTAFVLIALAGGGIAFSTETTSGQKTEKLSDGITLVNLNSTDKNELRHRDKDSTGSSLDLEESLKYEVEILQPNSIQRENIQIEERFKGPSLQFETDQFNSEEIEEISSNPIRKNHVLITLLLLVMTLASVGVYAALVIWRSYLEQRYGMRERLVTEDGFCYNADERHFTIDST